MWAKTGPDLQRSKDPPDRLRHMPDIRDDHCGSGLFAHIAPYGKHWWTWRTASHYNNGQVWSTGSPVALVLGCMLARPVGRWIIGWKNTREHLQAGTWPSLQLQSMQLMSHMSSIGKRPRWWTPIHDTIRDAHSSHGTSGRRPPQWTEMMAAYHRLITPSSTTRANHTPHIRPLQYYLFSIASFLPQLPSPFFLFLYTTTSIILSPHSFLFYPPQSFNPKPCMFCKHTHTHSHLYSAHAFFPLSRCKVPNQSPFNREKGTLLGLYAALLSGPCIHLA